MKKDKEIHDNAWNLLEEKGLKLGEKMMVRSAFITWSGYKNEHPFIEENEKNAEAKYYNSTIKWIKQFMFETKEEVILANAISVNCDDNCSSDEFIQKFKFTCRLLGVKSKWIE